MRRSIQNYTSAAIAPHGLTPGTATSEVTQHCAGNGALPDVTPVFGTTGVNFNCGLWTAENGPGTIVWALPTEEPTTFNSGDGANAFVYVD